MLIRFGYELALECLRPTPIVCLLSVHPSRAYAIRFDDGFQTKPQTSGSVYLDGYGNVCRRLTAPAGAVVMSDGGLIEDWGLCDAVQPDAAEIPIEQLPDGCWVHLLPSRYCESDLLGPIAWDLFSQAPPGWGRVQAICDVVHRHVRFGYEYAQPSRTAKQTWEEGVGVSRDFAHLAVAFCRCMNIPARYVTGYLGAVGASSDTTPTEFAAWFEAFVGGAWQTFDARWNRPQIGRILIARGRDAADVPLVNSFGPHTLTSLRVWTYEIDDAAVSAGANKS